MVGILYCISATHSQFWIMFVCAQICLWMYNSMWNTCNFLNTMPSTSIVHFWYLKPKVEYKALPCELYSQRDVTVCHLQGMYCQSHPYLSHILFKLFSLCQCQPTLYVLIATRLWSGDKAPLHTTLMNFLCVYLLRVPPVTITLSRPQVHTVNCWHFIASRMQTVCSGQYQDDNKRLI